jgi:prepilin-type N-terminal cleavage/methylation domain-containing protein
MMMMKRKRGFSLTEILIASLIMAIVGVAILGSLWILSGLLAQTEDYSVTQQEMETAFQTIGNQIGNAGLGMPNNKEGQGSFVESFYSAATPPVMASMGAISKDWGGPVTLATTPDLNPGSFVTVKTTLPDGQKVYAGPVLYYAWSLPTGVHIKAPEFPGTEIAQGDEVKLRFADGDVNILESFQYDGRAVGISEKNSPAASKASTRRWITFPTTRVPFWLAGWDNGGASRAGGSGQTNSAVAVMAPESRMSFYRTLSPYEEVHLVQCCRLYLKNGDLVQEFFDTGLQPADRIAKVVAKGIAGLYFTFDPEKRLVTMYIAARGTAPRASGDSVSPSDWPEFAPPISASDRKYPIITGAMRWRIRN